ncbi:MAG: hypothetical protein JWO31_3914, partial [Phycisphaerales bacterium]|nr:hypothetical protein [Phycisphaerales bacterium]
NFRGVSDSELTSARTWVGIVTVIAVGVYVAVVWQMYTGMVKNFDMTIRKQSR